MEHLVVLDELRVEAQRYLELAQRASDPEGRRKFMLAAGGISQLAEQLERDIPLTAAHVNAYREMLAEVLDDELRRAVDSLLHAKVEPAVGRG